MEKDYVREQSNPQTEDGDAAPRVSPNSDSGEEMVGHTGLFNTVKDRLLKKMRPKDTCFFSLHGEKGSHRTTAAKAIFDDFRGRGKQLFDCSAWVAVDAKHGDKEILIRIVAQVDSLAATDYEELTSMENGKLCNYLYRILENRRYMIVVDGVCHMQLVLYLRRSLPDQGNGSLLILTTDVETVARLADDFIGLNPPPHYPVPQRFLWQALRILMLRSGLIISPELEEAANKIIQNCRRLKIVAAKTFLFLSKLKTAEQWMEIAADEKNPIFMIVDEISEMRKIKAVIHPNNSDVDGTIGEVVVMVISTLIDFSGGVESIKEMIHPERFFSKMQIISLFGVSGVGKSTLADKIFKDDSVSCRFDHCLWVSLGPKYQADKIMIDILAQIYPRNILKDEKIVKYLRDQISRRRCLIVLDDLYSEEPLHQLRNLFPDIKGATLVTTTLAKAAKFGRDDLGYEMKLLDEEDSWRLLRRKVFGGEGLCPPQLQKVGRKIAENCGGLPLLILAVAEELLKVEMSEEYWNKVVSGEEKSIFMSAHCKISKAVL